MDAILTALASYGSTGLVIAALLIWLKRLQDRIDSEHEARLADSKAFAEAMRLLADERLEDAKVYNERALALQSAVHTSVDKLSELVEITISRSAAAQKRSQSTY